LSTTIWEEVKNWRIYFFIMNDPNFLGQQATSGLSDVGVIEFQMLSLFTKVKLKNKCSKYILLPSYCQTHVSTSRMVLE
jgi:hypothetical protein